MDSREGVRNQTLDRFAHIGNELGEPMLSTLRTCPVPSSTAAPSPVYVHTNLAGMAARYALAGLWLLDGVLQLQPFMFTSGFAHDILLPAAHGQPGVVAGPLHWSAHLIASHPVLSNTGFAIIQLLLGLALLIGPAVRVSLAASVVWSLSVWWLGESLGGLASGHAMLLTGAPGAVLVYAVLAAVAWPSSRTAAPGRGRQRSSATASWSTLWLVGAVYQLMPGQDTGRAISAAIDAATAGGPDWLAHAGHALAGQIPTGSPFAIALAAIQALIGLLVIVPGPARRIALFTGSGLAVAFWVFGQGLGELYTGQATDPDTAPLLLMLAGIIWVSSRADAAMAVTDEGRRTDSSGHATTARRRVLTASGGGSPAAIRPRM